MGGSKNKSPAQKQKSQQKESSKKSEEKKKDVSSRLINDALQLIRDKEDV